MNEVNNSLIQEFSEMFNKEVDIESLEKIEKMFEFESFPIDKDFVIERGDKGILLSAPHAVEQFRNDKIKASERRTGVIVMLIKRHIDAHIMYKVKNLQDDANYDTKSYYREKLVEYINYNKIKCLLDFHISAPFREYDIDIGTGNGKNICGRDDLLEILKCSLNKKYHNVVIDKCFSASNPNTVSATVSSHNSIPTFQIEINWGIIDNYEKMLEFVESMASAVIELEKKL